MIEIDPRDRINLTGPWPGFGFGFQGGHMFTPEGHQLGPGTRRYGLVLAEALTIR